MFTFTDITKDMLENSKKFYEQVPKTEKEAREFFERVKTVLQDENKNAQKMWQIYQKSTTGDASFNEIKEANKIFQELLASTRFAFLMAVPGAVFALPILTKMADEFGVDLVPASVKKEFGI